VAVCSGRDEPPEFRVKARISLHTLGGIKITSIVKSFAGNYYYKASVKNRVTQYFASGLFIVTALPTTIIAADTAVRLVGFKPPVSHLGMMPMDKEPQHRVAG